MTDVSGIPNLGIPGISGFNGGGGVNGINQPSGLASAQEQAMLNQRFFGQQAAAQAAAEVPQSQLYGGGGFGVQPAYYAGVGAAYGRAVAPSSSAAVAAEHGTPQAPRSVFETGAPPVPYSPPPGSFSPSPNYPGGSGRSVFETGAPPVPYQSSPPPGSFSPSPNYPGGSGDTFANRFGASPSVIDPLQKAPQGTLPQGIFDGVFGPTTPQAPGFSRASFMERFGAAPASDPNSFANRFAAGGYSQPGTPSEYTTAPYQEAGGTMRGPMQMPPGFSTPYSFDNPGGALPAGGFRGGGSPPIMNQGGDESPFEAGASHIGPTMGAFMGATPGGGVGRRTAPSSFAPSSPFESGTSPVPFPYVASGQALPGGGIGSTQGSMRDRIAAIMSGSQGMNEPTISGPPLVNGGPGGTGGPVPTQPQMNNAMDMLRQGRGWTIAQQAPPPQSGYAPINQAIYDVGNASRPGMFDNTTRPLGEMFAPGTYRGR